MCVYRCIGMFSVCLRVHSLLVTNTQDSVFENEGTRLGKTHGPGGIKVGEQGVCTDSHLFDRKPGDGGLGSCRHVFSARPFSISFIPQRE